MAFFFRVIIPTLGRDTLTRAIESVKNQTFKDWCLIVSHDGPVAGKKDEFESRLNYSEAVIRHLYSDEKIYDSGCRNRALQDKTWSSDTRYTLFLDDDDEFSSFDIFEKLHDFIVKEDYPDVIAYGYTKIIDSTGERRLQKRTEDTPKKLIESARVGICTKCVKSNLVPPLKEGMIHADRVHHLELCDRVETVKIFPESVFNWHRWEGSINMHPSRIDRASHWRLVQEYMCLNLKHDWAKAQQQKMVKQEAQYCIDHCTPTDLGFLSIEDECV
jgi:glycosyltransferase involved in cell wall biosynthesis